MLKQEKVTQNITDNLSKVTQNITGSSRIMKIHNYLIPFLLFHFVIVLYTPKILNRNIEQEIQEMPRKYTPQEKELLEYFHSIDKHAIKEILSEYHSTGPVGYASALILSRILKVKERISSDRELCTKLGTNPIYREAVGLRSHEIPAHNTFQRLSQRLGPDGRDSYPLPGIKFWLHYP